MLARQPPVTPQVAALYAMKAERPTRLAAEAERLQGAMGGWTYAPATARNGDRTQRVKSLVENI